MKVKTSSRVYLEVDLKAIRKNLRLIKNTVKPAKVMVVLKANGYGLGVLPIATELIKEDIYGFGVAELKEAVVLKKKFNKPVQILGSLLASEIPEAVKHGVICPIDSIDTAKLLSREAMKQNRKVKSHLLVDTGMGRLGIIHKDLGSILKVIRLLPNIDIEGIYSHFPDANKPKSSITGKQISIFSKLLKELDDCKFKWIHLANSDGINNYKKSYFNLVRTGINLYGVFDLKGKHTYKLKPTLALKTSLIAKRMMPKGHPIGYSCTHRLKKDTLVGTIPAGYADGIPLAASNKGEVLINGKACPIIGRVSMDYVTIDLSGSPDVQTGSEVVIIGSSGKRIITVEDIARLKKSHPYDIICSLGERVERCYI